MSNKVCLMSTKFVDRDGTTYGFRMFDDYGMAYNNCSERFVDGDFEILEYAKKMSHGNDILIGLFDYIQEHRTGIKINATWYDWEEIKGIFDL